MHNVLEANQGYMIDVCQSMHLMCFLSSSLPAPLQEKRLISKFFEEISQVGGRAGG
jgi:hypothetical protein